MKNVSIVIALLFVAWTASAQTGCIEGKVLDSEYPEEGLIGATVKVKQGNSIVFGTVTDFDGNFELAELEDNEYVLELSYPGMITHFIPFQIRNGNSILFLY